MMETLEGEDDSLEVCCKVLHLMVEKKWFVFIRGPRRSDSVCLGLLLKVFGGFCKREKTSSNIPDERKLILE